MISKLFRSFRHVTTGLILGLAAYGVADAGLVRGTWDPDFGPALPNLSWQVRSEWMIPDTVGCSNQATGVYSASSGLCAGARLLSLFVRWFNTDAGNPMDFFEPISSVSAYTGECEATWVSSQTDCSRFNITGNTFTIGNEPLQASSVRVAQSQIAAVDTGMTFAGFSTFGSPSSAGTHQYNLSFTTNGPVFTCADCMPAATSGNTDLTQFLVTYIDTDLGLVPKFGTPEHPVGVTLDAAGNVIPEPATLALLGLGLAGLGFSRRKQ